MRIHLSFMLSVLVNVMLPQGLSAQPGNLTLASPDGNVQVKVRVGDSVYYAVEFNKKLIVDWSSIALITAKGHLGVSPAVRRQERRSVSREITAPVPDKRSVIADRFNEMIIHFRKNYSLILRAYDDGAAFRWSADMPDSLTVLSETVNINFAANDTVYYPRIQCPEVREGNADCYHTGFEELYQVRPLNSIQDDDMAFLPLLVDGKENFKMLITEADLLDYPGMFVVGKGSTRPSLRADFAPYPLEERQVGYYTQDIVVKRADFIAKTKGRRNFPWRVFLLASDDRQLPESDMIYRLAEANRIGDVSWIKPGKSTSEWLIDNNIYGVDFRSGYNTQTYQYYIDFAHKFGLEYVLFDAGWSSINDLFSITPEMDMEFLVGYAKEKNVGLVLWTSAHAISRQMDSALDHFQSWGIKGIMVDFMNRDDQKMVRFYERVAHEASKRKIFVDFHGSYKPTGLRRTYPNVMTMEGAVVQEYYKWSDGMPGPEYEVTIPFIRNVAGPLDYEPGNMLNEIAANYHPMNNKPTSLGTRVHQLAMFIIYESPYAKMGGNPSDYLKEPAFTQFIVDIPTVWRETKAIEAQVGDYIVLRREALNGDIYVAAMTDWSARDFKVKLDFLEEGTYTMEVYSDGVNADRYASDHARTTMTVTKNDSIELHLAPGGGWVGKISPLTR